MKTRPRLCLCKRSVLAAWLSIKRPSKKEAFYLTQSLHIKRGVFFADFC